MSEPRPQAIVQSLGWALRGIGDTLITQRNMRIHYYAATLAGIAASLLALDRLETLFVLAAIALVFAAELVNTAIEATVDLATGAVHPLARLAKDAAAGAVLICAVFAVAVGALVFGDKLAPLRLRAGGIGWAVAVGVSSLLGRGWLALATARRRREQRTIPEAPLSLIE